MSQTASRGLAGGRTRCSGALLRFAVMCTVLVAGPGVSRADAVDEAFSRGNQAAEAADWSEAIGHYRRAARLLPERNSVLSYNLGTAYAHLGELGPATYHLRRALHFDGGPSAELLEAARYNLAVVRRRAELQADASGAKIDRPESWWDLGLAALEAPWVGWVSLLSGFAFVALVIIIRRRRRRGANVYGGAMPVLLIVTGLTYLGPGVLHGLALRADHVAPPAVVLKQRVEVRKRPGSHGDVVFTVQGGARVRIVDESSGWRRIRLPGGLTGWVVASDVGQLDARGGVGLGTPMPAAGVSG